MLTVLPGLRRLRQQRTAVRRGKRHGLKITSTALAWVRGLKITSTALAWVRGLKITSTALARVCVTLLVLYPVLAFLVWIYLASYNYGILAALFAANAGTAFVVFFVLSSPEFSNYTLGALIVLIIAMISGLLSGVYWIWDEVDHNLRGMSRIRACGLTTGYGAL